MGELLVVNFKLFMDLRESSARVYLQFGWVDYPVCIFGEGKGTSPSSLLCACLSSSSAVETEIELLSLGFCDFDLIESLRTIEANFHANVNTALQQDERQGVGTNGRLGTIRLAVLI